MNVGTINRIETGVERGSAGLFGASVGYAGYVGLGAIVSPPELVVCAAAGGIFAHLLCSRALQAAARGARQFHVPLFNVADIDAIDDELLLTDADRLSDELVLTDADRLHAGEALVLNDILAEIGPDSRVVRLFDRSAMPTPGQLRSRIENYRDQAPQPVPDASQALSEALAELRRSLR
ncbi:MAG TPA: hypothetical protein VJT70_09175 [Sphingomicrobium sp.]|nr:hypothetical protein [Sphingomicrobium sp.]